MVAESKRMIAPALAALAAAALLMTAPLAHAGGPKTVPPGKAVTVHGPPAKTPAHNAQQTGKGVVQLVTTKAVVLKQLDGSRVRVPVDRLTRVFINGKRARLTDVKSGYVLVADWTAGEPARELRFLRAS